MYESNIYIKNNEVKQTGVPELLSRNDRDLLGI